MKKHIIYFLILLLIIQTSLAATIYGTVYDSTLEKAPNVQITINTTPVQHQISKDSDYSFEVPAGTYSLKAEQYQYNEVVAEMQQEITVSEQGTYRLDLILFPVFEDFGENETEFIEESITETKTVIWPYITLLIILTLIILYFIKNKPKKPKIPEDLQEMYDFIKKEKRTTQKELRKKFPLSEAKVSLMVSELEEKGLIKKFKKGRGNIIIPK
jgi:uncharacterized membrane protein